MSLPKVNNLVSIVNKARLTLYDQLIKETYLSNMSINGTNIQFTYGNKTTKSVALPILKGASSSANGTAGLVPAPAKVKRGSYLRGDGTWSTPTNTTYTLESVMGNTKLVPSTGNPITVQNNIYYAECDTASNVAAKIVECDGFVLEKGAVISIRFTDAVASAGPTSGNITLNVNGTGDKNVCTKDVDTLLTYTAWWYFRFNSMRLFVYDGTKFVMINNDNNTKYSAAGSGLGLVKTGGDVTISDGIITVKDDSHNHTIANIDGLQTKLDSRALIKTIYSDDDLNDITTPGFYNADGGNKILNKPDNINHFGMYVIHRAIGAYYTQVIFGSDKKMYIRHCDDNVWTDWEVIDGKGTITGIKMNGESKGTSGVIDLGTILTGGAQTTTSTADGGSNVYTFSDGSTITVKNGSKGSNGTTPTIKAASGVNIASVGTPSVTASTSGATTTFTFNNLKGASGNNGTSAAWFTGTVVTGTSTTATNFTVSGSKAGDMYLNTSTSNVYRASAANSWVYVCNIKGTNATTTAVATTTANGLMSSSDKKSLDILKSPIAVCATSSDVIAKVATLENFSLTIGTTVAVKFTDTGTARPTSGNLTLNINGTGAKTMGYFRNGYKAPLTYNSAYLFCNNNNHIFTYDGTYWLCMDWNADNNTTYTNMTGATSSEIGKAGLVPAPDAGSENKFLRGDGTWSEIVASVADASTLNGKTASDFAVNNVISTLDVVNDPGLESGIYSVENVSMAFSSNLASSYFVLIVNKHKVGHGWGTQIAIPYENGNMIGVFYRNAVGTTWHDWCNISGDLKTTDLPTLNITAKSFTSTEPNGLRLAYGNYGFFIRNDGNDIWFLLTAAGNPNGSYNSFRPVRINNATGLTEIGNGLNVYNGGQSLSVTTGGTNTTGWLTSHAGRSNTPRTDYANYQWRNVAASTSATPTTNATYGTSGAIYLQYT